MRKLLFICLFVMASQMSYAQVSDPVFEKYKAQETAEYVNIPPTLFSVVKNEISKKCPPLANLQSLKMLQIKKAQKSQCDAILNDLNALGSKGLRQEMKKENAYMFVSKKDGFITELLTFDFRSSTISMIQMFGKIKIEDLEKLSGAEFGGLLDSDENENEE